VFEQTTIEMATEVPFDPHDLPGYAGRLVRLHDRRPEIMRLVTWQRLERNDGGPNPLAVAALRSQVEAIADAQKAGELPAHFPPGVIFGLVLHIAAGWTARNAEFDAAIPVPDLDERVHHVENAVRAMLGQNIVPA
jgi:Tetracyclin repressor-like, C-terminal domain